MNSRASRGISWGHGPGDTSRKLACVCSLLRGCGRREREREAGSKGPLVGVGGGGEGRRTSREDEGSAIEWRYQEATASPVVTATGPCIVATERERSPPPREYPRDIAAVW